MGQLPQDPIMLYSVINTKLRDFYSSLEVLCEDMGLSEEELKEKLSSAGFEYDKDRNQFIQYYKNFFLIPVILLLTSAQPLPLLLLSVLLLFHLMKPAGTHCHGAFPLSSTSTSAYVLSYIHRPSGNTDSYLMSRTTSLPDHPHPNSPDIPLFHLPHRSNNMHINHIDLL